MTSSDGVTRAPNLALIIFWLASGTFAIGCSEFAAMSLLPYYAASFGADEPTAGHAVSAYALGVVVGAPLIATLCARMSRKRLLLILMAVFAVGNFLSALAPSLQSLNMARFVSGLPHGAYFGIAMLFAADLAGKGRRAQAVSYIILGLTIANVIGVPAISALGQFVGWRVAFVVIAVLAAFSVLMVWRTAPDDGPHPDASPLKELRALVNKRVLMTLAMGAIGFGGMFAVYAYFSATLLEDPRNPEWIIAVILVLFGVGSTFGNWLAGRVSSGRLLASAAAFQAFMGLSAGFYAVSVGTWPLMAAAIFFIGIGGGMVVPLQTRLMDVAGEAQTLAAAMNHAAFNFANALGPFLAGLALAAGWGTRAPGWIGVGLSVWGLIICALIALSERNRSEQTAA